MKFCNFGKIAFMKTIDKNIFIREEKKWVILYDVMSRENLSHK